MNDFERERYLKEVFTYLDAVTDDMTRELIKQIRIPSVKAPKIELDSPFGAELRRSLDAALSLGERLGLKPLDMEGHLGCLDYGKGEEMLGVLVHLDVVPAGDGWIHDPFGGQLEQGRIYGRGAIDDKGPAIAAIYAIAAIKAAKIPLARKVRILLGCDEEDAWDCIAHYKRSDQSLPNLSFSPDGNYPLVYAERGICQADFTCKRDLSEKPYEISISCGERANVVPGTAKAFVPIPVGSLQAPKGFEVEIKSVQGGSSIKVIGRSAHASTPEQGKNALQYLLQILRTLELPEKESAIVSGLSSLFSMDMHGEGFAGLDVTDESGRLSLIPAMLHWDENSICLTVDVRHPLCLTAQGVLDRLGNAFSPMGFQLTRTQIKDGLMVSPESKLVQSLLSVYRKHSGDYVNEPLTVGGGSYARAFPNAVAFGCLMPGNPMLAHMPEEFFTLDDLRFNARVIAEAIITLAGE